MRLPTELWVKVYLRRLSADGVFAAVVYHGDDDFGTVWVKVNRLDGSAALYGPAPEGFGEAVPERRWLRMHKPDSVDGSEADAQIQKTRSLDRDLWLIEIEDRLGRHGLGDGLIKG
jgi:hypothetical protein